MALHRPRASDRAQSARHNTGRLNRATNRKLLFIDRSKCPPQEALGEVLLSGLLAADNELGHILNEVEGISDTLKPDSNHTQILSNALQRAVRCAVKQSLLDRELRSLALTDDLTGLYNRRGFFASATQQLKLARRNSQGFLLLFGDVDNLKQINDSYGHLEGDRALIRVAEALQRTFRDADILARLSGDEFAVLASEASAQNQEVMFRRLEKSLKKPNEKESRYELTLSFGVVQFDARLPVSLGDLMEQADQAMYEQKRNKVKLLATKL
jgi:diguanylate cyclase (GGDEF)-like protein